MNRAGKNLAALMTVLAARRVSPLPSLLDALGSGCMYACMSDVERYMGWCTAYL